MTVRKMCLSGEGKRKKEENLINQNDVEKTCVRVRMSEKLWETAQEIVKAFFLSSSTLHGAFNRLKKHTRFFIQTIP